jgi:hypothetical protein
MASIRENHHLRAIFGISKWTGVWIPEKQGDGHFSKNITVWEVAVHVAIVCVFVSIMRWLISTMPSFTITHIGTPLVVFVIYSVNLCNAINLIENKNKLSLLLKTFDEMTQFQSFGDLHKNVVNKLCRRVKVFTISSLVLSIFCLFLSIAAYSQLHTDSEQIQKNSTQLRNLTEDEMTVLKMTGNKHITLSVFENIVLGMHGIISFVLLFKTFIMNSLMFLCHEFIIEELHILVSFIKLLKNNKMECKIIAFQTSSTQEHWLHFFGKIHKYVETILQPSAIHNPLSRALKILNCIFGFQVMTLVAGSTILLSFNALMAAVVG